MEEISLIFLGKDFVLIEFLKKKFFFFIDSLCNCSQLGPCRVHRQSLRYFLLCLLLYTLPLSVVHPLQ